MTPPVVREKREKKEERKTNMMSSCKSCEVSSEGGRQFISEFLGTYYLVLTVGLNVLLGAR